MDGVLVENNADNKTGCLANVMHVPASQAGATLAAAALDVDRFTQSVDGLCDTGLFGDVFDAASAQDVTATLEKELHKVLIEHAAKQRHVAADAEDSEEANKFKAAIESNNYELRNTWIGRVWYQALRDDEALASEYNKVKTRLAQREFRAQWTKRQLQMLQVGRTHSSIVRTVNKSRGTYLCFGKIAENLGYAVDAKRATRAAFTYCAKACKMGGEWAWYEPMSETMMFMWYEFQYHHEVEEAWTVWEKEHMTYDRGDAVPSGSAGSSMSAAVGDEGDATVQPTPLKTKGHAPAPKIACAKAAAPARKLPQRAVKAEPVVTPTGDDAGADAVATKKLLNARLAETAKLKAMMINATSAATAIQELISKESSWAWAANDANLGTLQRVHAELQERLTVWDRELLASDGKEMRLKYGSEHLMVHTNMFLQHADVVKRLQSRVTMLQKMHKCAGSA
jgi:hypothetical protein